MVIWSLFGFSETDIGARKTDSLGLTVLFLLAGNKIMNYLISDSTFVKVNILLPVSLNAETDNNISDTSMVGM